LLIQQPHGSEKRILIVDDKLVRWALTQKCAEFGFQSIEASSGEEALQAL
jgi:CheY-like chemotaxis protein